MAKKRVTLRDVAKLAEVSPTTVSMVLNNKARDFKISDACIRRVRQAALAAQYTPNHHAMSMRLGKSMTIGMCVNVAGYVQGRPPFPLTDNYFYTGLVFGGEGAVHEVGYDMLLIGPGGELKAANRGIEALRRGQIDALVLPSMPLSEAEMAQTMPMVLISPRTPASFPQVVFDHVGAAQQVADHLSKLGHRSALWLGPAEEGDRELLIFRAASEAGIRLATCTYDLLPRHDIGNEGYEEYCVAQACEKLLARLAHPRDFTAVIAYNDAVALGACRALRRKGLRVPEDISVIGWDNALPGRMADPILTTIDHRFGEMGYQAGKLACEMAEGGDETMERLKNHQVVVPSKLVIQESTGPAPLLVDRAR
jgi:LacI family transcriptional regulator, galactose operon repressor